MGKPLAREDKELVSGRGKFCVKVLFVHHGAVPGGAPTSLRNMVHGIARDSDFSCRICCIRPEMMPFFSSLENVEVEQYPETGLFSGRVFMGWSRGISLRRFFAFILELTRSPLNILREIRFLKSRNPDIVHLNSSILWMSAIAAKISKIPIVWHIREASDDTPYNIIRLTYAWFVRKIADRVICIGPQEYRKIGGRNTEKVVTIYNSLTDVYFKNDAYNKNELRKMLGLPENCYLYLSLGGTSFRKGTYQFIGALDYLTKDCKAVLVGAGPKGKKQGGVASIYSFRHRIENILVRKGIKKYYSWCYQERIASQLKHVDCQQLFLAGVVEDVSLYIKACDVLVFSGTTPHSGRPVYEAWALKKPVIAFDTEVMRQDIEPGVDGLLVAEHTAESLAQAIVSLKKHPELAEKMGKAGYQKARERFSSQANNEQIARLYKEIISENRF